VRNLVCSHCQSVVNPNASVCAGCGAEIVRGASRKERATAGCLSSIIGVLIAFAALGFILPSVGSSNKFGLPVVLAILLSAVVFNLLGRLLVRLLFRARLRFFRAYQHR
jgi:hypothetical protein